MGQAEQRIALKVLSKRHLRSIELGKFLDQHLRPLVNLTADRTIALPQFRQRQLVLDKIIDVAGQKFREMLGIGHFEQHIEMIIAKSLLSDNFFNLRILLGPHIPLQIGHQIEFKLFQQIANRARIVADLVK